jgi:cell division protease FtsH
LRRLAIRIRRAVSAYVNVMFHGDGWNLVVSWAAVACLIVAIINIGYVLSPDYPRHLDTSDIMAQVQSHNVSYMHISAEDWSVDGSLRDPVNGVVRFDGILPDSSDATMRVIIESGVAYDMTKPNAFVSTLIVILRTSVPTVIGIAAIFFIMSQMGSMDLTDRRKDDKFVGTKVNISFADVCGEPEAVEEVSELVTFVKDRSVYDSTGAKTPRGILLQGSPGNGKTLLAKALAGEAGVPFYATSGSDFVEMYVGVGAKRIRELFEVARENQPSIIFIDEIDAIGGNRDASVASGYTEEHLQTLNQLLTEMDGFDADDNVMVIAATNRSDSLDPALLRPGRFDRVITVDNPAMAGRADILKHYAIGHPFAQPIDFDRLAKHTYGFSGAQLESVMNQAATLAARRSLSDGSTPVITNDDIEEGIARVIGGPAAKSRTMSDDERRIVAYHEAGHAVVQYVLPNCDPVQKISIVSRNVAQVGATMGYVQTYSEQDRYVNTVEQVMDEIAALLGGRCSEEMFCGTETTGASDDLQRASRLAYSMSTQFAFAPEDGNGWNHEHLRMALGGSGRDSSGVARLNRIDAEADACLQKQFERASEILDTHRNDVESIVGKLLADEQIDAEDIMEIMEGHTGEKA